MEYWKGHNQGDDVKNKNGEVKTNWWRVFWVLGALSLVVGVPTGYYLSKDSRARETLDRLEISEAQRRVLEDYSRVMSELNLQIRDVSKGEFTIDDAPPEVYWNYMPLNKSKNHKLITK